MQCYLNAVRKRDGPLTDSQLLIRQIILCNYLESGLNWMSSVFGVVGFESDLYPSLDALTSRTSEMSLKALSCIEGCPLHICNLLRDVNCPHCKFFLHGDFAALRIPLLIEVLLDFFDGGWLDYRFQLQSEFSKGGPSF